MRIRNSTTSSVSHFPSPPSTSTSSSSANSTISTHSLTSSSSSDSTSPFTPTPRCNGLDLLVKAVYHVAGSVIGVPYIQRRVIRRRKRAVKFSTFVIDLIKDCELRDGVDDQVGNGQVFDGFDVVNKVRTRSNALPFKYKDSVLQDGKTSNRRRKRSSNA